MSSAHSGKSPLGSSGGIGGNGGNDGNDDKKKPAVPETDTDDLKRFREKWKRELQPTQQTHSAPASTATPTSSALSSTSNTSSANTSLHSGEAKRDTSFHHKHVGENKLILKFLALLEEEEENEENNEQENENPEEDQARNYIGVLPSELQLAILAHLDVRALETCSTTCRFWYILARDEVLPQFQQLCLDTWSGITTQIFEAYQCDWRTMYLNRPRLRDDGIYISRNYYLRPGQTEGAYYQPVHEVVYYRYLRFFSTGAVIYTLSSDAPKQVLNWFKPSYSSDLSHRSVHTEERYVLEGSQVQVWMRISSHHTTCLTLDLTSSKPSRNDRLNLLEYKCVHENDEVDQIDVNIKKFQFVKLPKHYLIDDFPVNNEV